VAYSYYGDPTTAVSSLTDIDPGKDLVWGSKAQSVTTTESTQKVSIKMTHRFAQVRVKIDASTIATAITDIGTVTVTGGKTANLTEETGDVAPTSTNANQTVDFPSSTSNVRTSDYCTYWQAITGVSISSITLTIASVAKTFTGLTAYFSKTLEAGKSYTLEVDLKRIIFAGSNIYWDAGNDRLTFDESTNSNYQGVYFQWGSLVGLSAMGVVNNDMRLYIPNVSDGTWDGTKTIGSSSWANYSSLPHIESVYGTGAADNYLYDHPNFENYKGDICAYLTGKAGTPAGSWRLPNAEEYSMIVSHEKVTGSISGQNEAGTGTMTAGIDFGTGIFFPCVGFRNAISTPDVTGTSGFYTSGTPFGTDASNTWFRYYFDINAISNVIGVYNYAYIDGMSVRCLKI
jgi:hypothetical protein